MGWEVEEEYIPSCASERSGVGCWVERVIGQGAVGRKRAQWQKWGGGPDSWEVEGGVKTEEWEF